MHERIALYSADAMSAWHCLFTKWKAVIKCAQSKELIKQIHPAHHNPQSNLKTCSLHLLTPCSSSFISCSVTLGVLSARRKQWTLSSGTRYSSTSLRGRPRPRPCLDVEGTASSRMEPRRVFSWRPPIMQEKNNKNTIAGVKAIMIFT